jgi:hypothetical protein
VAGTDVCKHVVRDVATGGNSSPVLLTQPLPVKISPSRPPVVGVVVVYFFIESLPAVLVLLECSYTFTKRNPQKAKCASQSAVYRYHPSEAIGGRGVGSVTFVRACQLLFCTHFQIILTVACTKATGTTGRLPVPGTVA